MKREILERPFPKNLIKTRQGSFGRELSYVEARHYVERLNEAFEGAWHFEIVLHDILQDEVFVLGTLKAGGITKQAFGGSQITKRRDNGEVLSIADDLKAAATDALKKAASLFGVGQHLYGDDSVTVSDGHEKGSLPGGGNGNGHDPFPPHHPQYDHAPAGQNGNGRLTARQLSAIWSFARQRDLAQRELRRRCMESWGKQPEFLSKAEASTLIDQMKNGR